MSSANSWAWISTMLTDTRQVVRALIIDNTFWLTLHIWVSNVVADTFTRCSSISFSAFCINTARRRVARLNHYNRPLCCCCITVGKWITNMIRVANTDGYMIANSTLCINATKTWARIDTLLAFTGFVSRAISVGYTFRVTVRGETKHARQAGAVTFEAIISRRVAIRTTWIWIAGIIWYNGCNR